MTYTSQGETDSTWALGRRFRALGLSSLCFLSANPALAHAVGNWGAHAAHAVPQQQQAHGQSPARFYGFTQTAPVATAAPAHMFAHTAHTNLFFNPAANLPAQGLNLDLTSSIANIILGTEMFAGSSNASATINVGGAARTFQAGQKVTAAEYVAIQEAAAGAAQTITLNHRGAATGGSVDLSQIGALKTAQVVIPRHVTAIDDFAANSQLNITGNLINYGSIEGVSSSNSVHAGTISAGDIINRSGAVISSGNMPNGGALDLTLLSSGNISNAGQIVSTGALTLNAAGSIANTPSVVALPGHTAAPSIKAGGDVNLISGAGSFTNSGLIASTSGNVNFNAPAAQDINIAGSCGTIQALAGDINVRNAGYSGAANVNLCGGDYLSQNLNVNAGAGNITGNIGEVTGNFNSVATSDHVLVSSDALKLGNNQINGDPLFVNAAGDIDITGSLDVTSENQPLTIIASGNISATTKAAQLINNGGDITLIAGYGVTYSGSQTTSSLPPGSQADASATVDFTSTVGTGSILLQGSGASTIIDSSIASGRGGNVTLVAPNSVQVADSATIDTHSDKGAGGNVTVIAAGTGVAANIGSVNASGTTSSGNLQLTNANPTGNKSSSITYDITGAVDPGSSSTAIVPDLQRFTGSISVQGIQAANITVDTPGGAVFFGSPNVIASPDASGNGSNIAVNSINILYFNSNNQSLLFDASGTTSGKGNGGSVSINTSAVGHIGKGANDFQLRAMSGSSGGDGGSVSFSSSSFVIVDDADGLVAEPLTSKGNGGTVTLSADSLAFGGKLDLHANGGTNGGNGGTVNLITNQDLSIGTSVGDVFITALGGTAGGASPANGGTANIITGGKLTFDGSGPYANVDPSPSSSGNGGNMMFTAKSIAFTGNLSLFSTPGTVGSANGGIISLKLLSNTDLTIGSGVGQISMIAQGGASGGNGGTVSLETLGSVSFATNSSILNFNVGSGGTDGNGGNIFLKANKILNLDVGNALTFDASAQGTGRGGSISIIDTSSADSPVLGSAPGQILLRANGGTAAGTAGGTVSFTAGGNLTVKPDGIEVHGGAGTVDSAQGTVSLTANFISESKSDTLTAGSINLTGGTLSIGGSAPFKIAASNLTVNNVGYVNIQNTGPLTLGTSTSMGDLRISTVPDGNGDGGIKIGHMAFLTAPAVYLTSSEDVKAGGKGGISQVDALSFDVRFPTINSPSISLTDNDGSTTGKGNGDIAVLTANLYGATKISVASAGIVNIFDGSAGSTTVDFGGASGSKISFSALHDLDLAAMPTAANQLSLTASATNLGGNLTLPTGVNVIAAKEDSSGNGGSISVAADQIIVPGGKALVFNASGTTGAGGHIDVSVFKTPTLTLGLAAGDMSFVATGTSGGEVVISNNGGTLALDTSVVGGFATPTGLNIAASAGNGGKIELLYKNISWSLQGATPLLLSADAKGAGNGGSVRLSQFNPSATTLLGSKGINDIALSAAGGATSGNGGTVSVFSLGSVFVDDGSGINVSPASKTGNGGSISLSAGQISNSSGAAVILNASPLAGGKGDGGSINLSSNGDITLGNSINGFELFAQGGSGGGNGGSASVFASGFLVQGNIFVGASAINVGPLATNGNGGKIEISGKNLIADASITSISLNANGKGTGGGGSISLALSTSAQITLGNVPSGLMLSATGANGGHIEFTAENSAVNVLTTVTKGQAVPTGLAVTATGKNGNGGELNLDFDSLTYQNSGTAPLALNAAGLGTGNGGTVSLALQSGDINVGTGAGAVSISAAGANGGSATLSASSGQINLSTTTGPQGATPAGLAIGPTGTNGNGGAISLTAQNVVWDTEATLPLNLDVSGKGTGNGGSINVHELSGAPIAIGVLAANLRLTANSGATGGNAGAISVSVSGDLGVDLKGLQANVLGANGNGAQISLSGNTVAAAIPGTLALDASGKGTGNGGSINISIGGSAPISIGAGGDFALTAKGGTSAGDGGQINFTGGNGLTVDGAFIDVSAGAGGTDGEILLGAPTIVVTGKDITANILNVSTLGDSDFRANVRQLEFSSQGSLTIRNTGPVTLVGGGSVANNFALVVTPDGQGNGSITIGPDGSFSAGSSISLTSGQANITNTNIPGTGGITQVAGPEQVGLFAPAISLTNVNTGTGPSSDISVVTGSFQSANPTTLTVNTTGNATIIDRSPDSLVLGASQASSLSVASFSHVLLIGDNVVGTNAVNLYGSAIVVAPSASIVGNSVAIHGFGANQATGSSIFVTNQGLIEGNSVYVLGAPGTDLSFNNTTSVFGTASGVYIAAVADASDNYGSVFIGGGVLNTLSATDGTINITAIPSADGLSANKVEFVSDMTFSGITNITASGVYQSIVVDKSVSVTGTSAVNVMTPLFVEQGTMVGNPLNFSSGGSGMTIADSSGAAIDLSSINWNLLGTSPFNLVVVSTGSIVDNGNLVIIDTHGGSITMFAGFDFLPAYTDPTNPTNLLLTIQTTTAKTGSITIDQTQLLTGGASNTNGNVTLYANNGSITTGLMLTNGTGGKAGDVTIIGHDITLDTGINTFSKTGSPNLSGNVNITAANINISAPILVQAGGLAGGTISPAAGGGSITFDTARGGAINAGDGKVALTATNGFIGAFAKQIVVNAGELSMNGGGVGASGDYLLVNVPVLNGITMTGSLMLADFTSATLTGLHSAADYNLALDHGNLKIGSGVTVTGSSSVSLASSEGSISMEDNTAAIDSKVVSLSAASSIGANTPLDIITSGNVQLNTPSLGGSLNVTAAASNLTLSAATTSGDYSVNNIGTITVNGTIQAGTGKALTLISQTGDISFKAGVFAAGASTFDLEAASGNLTLPTLVAAPNPDGGSITVIGKTLTLSPTSSTVFNADGAGVAGTINVNIQSTPLTIGFGLGELSLSANGGSQGGTISVTAPGGQLNYDGAAISVSGATQGSVNLTAGDIHPTSSNLLVASNLNLTATTGNIGTGGAHVQVSVANLTANSQGNIFINATGPITLGTSSGNTSSGVINIAVSESGGDGSITIAKGATLTASEVQLFSDQSGAGIGGIKQLDDSQTTTIFGAGIQLVSNGTGDITVTTDQGASPAAFNAIADAGSTITITTAAFNATGGDLVRAGTVIIHGLVGSDLTINNPAVIEASKGITVDSTPSAGGIGGNIIIQGGGEFQGDSTGTPVLIKANTNPAGSSSNGIEFSGDQTFTGAITLQASGSGQYVQNDPGVTVTATLGSAGTILTPLLINNGTFSGNWTFAPTPGLAGTYASASTIDISSLPTLSFPGQQLTILSGGSIVDNFLTGKSIDLSSPTGGGTLYLLAGFDFTPAPSGSPDHTTTFNITKLNGPGNILLGNNTIDTSSTLGAGGNVFVYANGVINIQTIKASGGTTGGGVTMVGNTVVTLGIDTSGPSNGAVNISSAVVDLVFNGSNTSISVNNGQVFGGSFQAGTPVGSISIQGGINASANSMAGSNPVILNALAGGIEVRNSANPTGTAILTNNFGTVILQAGDGGIIGGGAAGPLHTDAAFLTASATTDQMHLTRIITTNPNTTLVGVNGGGSFFDVTTDTGKALTIGANAVVSADILNLFSETDLTFQPGSVVSARNATLSARGIMTLTPGMFDVQNSASGASVSIGIAADVVSTGGSIDINANNLLGPSAVSIFATKVSAPLTVVSTSASSGGQITAQIGTLSAGADLSLNAAAPSGGAGGGQITMIIDKISAGLVADARAGKNGDGGNIQLFSQNDLTMGGNTGEVQMIATGGTSSGNGGTVGLFTNGFLSVDVDINGNATGKNLAIYADPLAAGGNGASLNVSADKGFSWSGLVPLIFSANGLDTGSGGLINIGANTGTVDIGDTSGSLKLNAMSGVNGGNGGSVGVGAQNINITAANGWSINPRGANGDGGQISLGAINAVNNKTGGLFTLQANGVGTGNGGGVGINALAPQTITIGSSPSSTFQLIANSGPNGGSGGKAFVSSGGNIVADPSGISVTARGNGDGGSVILSAGNAGTGTVQVTSSLSLNGSGSGNGGSLTLTSNSKTALTLGGKKVANGLQGTVSLLGGGLNGVLRLENHGGAVVISQALSQVDQVTLRSGSNGNITVSNNLGNSKSNSIYLSTTDFGASTGKIAAKTLFAEQVQATVGNQPLTLTTSTGALTATSGGTVTVTNVGTGNLSIFSATGTKTTIKSAGDITVSGSTKTTALTLQSTSKTNGKIAVTGSIDTTAGSIALTAPGDISISGPVKAAGKTSAITLTSTGSGSTITVNGSLIADSKVAISAAKGSFSSNNAGVVTSNSSTVAITALNTINGAGAITGSGAVTIKSTGAIAGNAITLGKVTSTKANVAVTAIGTILNNDTVSAFTTIAETSSGSKTIAGGIDVEASLLADTAGSKGAITLTAPAVGGLIIDNGNVSAINNITFTAAKGTITQGVVILTSANGAVAFTAGNKIAQGGSITAGTNATLKTTIASSDAINNFVSFNNIKTNNGAISVIGAGAFVNSVGGTIDAGSTVKTAKATVLIENSNTKLTTGTPVVIGGGTTVKTGGPGGGNINVSFGAPAKGVAGTAPSNAEYTINGSKIPFPPPSTGPFFFSSSGITVNPLPTAAHLTFDSENPGNLANKGQIIFTTGKFGAGAISIQNDSLTVTSFLADPPLLASQTMHAAQAVTANIPAINRLYVPSLNAGAQGSAIQNQTLAPVVQSAGKIVSGRPALTDFVGYAVANTTPRNGLAWISDTEIASGSIPAVLHSEQDLGVRNDVSSVLDMEELNPQSLQMAPAVKVSGPQNSTTGARLSGSISENIGSGKSMMLRRGSVVFAPTVDTLVHTEHGTVSIAAKSLVLVISYSRGVAVYDLDDKRQNAVKVTAAGKTIVLAPGRSVVLTNHHVQRFEEINPAQRFAYRGIKMHELGEGRRAFTADFSAMTAAAAVLPIRQLMRSDNAEARHITDRLLKTTAIIGQMQAAAGPYQLYIRPGLTACAR